MLSHRYLPTLCDATFLTLSALARSQLTLPATKDGDHYKKAAFGKGQPLDSPLTNTSDAEKVT